MSTSAIIEAKNVIFVSRCGQPQGKNHNKAATKSKKTMFEDFKLRVFMAVAENGSFTIAAKTLGVTQPAVSQNIAELERNMGAELFTRGRGAVTLTAAGITFKEYAEKILYWYSAAGRLFGQSGKITANKPVRISADGFIASHILPEAISKLLTFNPSLTFTIHGNSSGEDSDIRIYAQRHVVEPSFEDIGTFLFSVTTSAVSSNPAYSKTADLKALPQETMLAVTETCSEILPLDLKTRVAVVSDSAETIGRLVKDSPDIIGLLPLPAVPPELIPLPVTLPELTMDVHLEATDGTNPVAAALRRILCDQYPDTSDHLKPEYRP